MSDRRTSGFGQGFSKEVDSILSASELGHLYPDEVRENLRIAGMVLQREAEMPVFNYAQPDEEVADDDTEGEELTDD